MMRALDAARQLALAHHHHAHRNDSLRTPKGAETDISTLLSADILALLLQTAFANQRLWNAVSLKSAFSPKADLESQGCIGLLCADIVAKVFLG
jgi:hypothetical protein